MIDYLTDVFGPNGHLAQAFPGYEPRPGQVALAQMVDQAICEERHLLGEAPCGTGKGVAYCTPAIYHLGTSKGKPTIIATANIALQEQLITKDLPFLAKVLLWPFTFALLKGKSRYLCRWASKRGEKHGHGRVSAADSEQIAAIESWALNTVAGDVSELPFVPSPQVWGRFSTTPEDCKGEHCPYINSCFAEHARIIAFNSNIIVVNFHLLFAHLSVRKETGQNIVLPPCDRFILDEAHEAADIAREFFGFSLSEFTFKRLARFAGEYNDIQLAKTLEHEAKTFFEEVADHARSPAYQCRLRKPVFAAQKTLLGALGHVCNLVAELLGEGAEGDTESAFDALPPLEAKEARSTRRSAQKAATHLREFLTLSDPNKVYFIELNEHGRAKLRANVLDVSDILDKELFGEAKTVVMVSATMTAGGNFNFVRGEVGAPEDALEIIAESPFNFERQALLIVPEGVPEPRDAGFVAATAGVLTRVIELCNGRTLGLFTARANMDAVCPLVRAALKRANCPISVLKQDDLPRNTLSRMFKEDVSSVLLGTSSFWTGIDVPGEALTAVVIDKLPFPNMSDPTINALCEQDAQGSFGRHTLPRAIITLRQGVGRLVRSKSDVGVVVICDGRLLSGKGYGRAMINSLPPMSLTRRLDDIPYFLKGVVRPCKGRYLVSLGDRFLGSFPTAEKAMQVYEKACKGAKK